MFISIPKTKIIMSLLIALSISACGGGGGGSSSDNGDPTNDFAIFQVTPQEGDTNVDANDNVIAIMYNKEILPTSVDNNSITLSNDTGTINATVELNAITQSIFLDPDSFQLAANTTYTVNVANTVADLNGNFAAAFCWQFSTGSSINTNISCNNGGNNNGGNNNGGNNGGNGGVWDTATPIKNNSSIVANNSLQITSDDNGNAIAVWAQQPDVNSTSDIYSSFYDATTKQWGTATVISASQEQGTKPQIFFYNDDAIALWVTETNLNYSLAIRQFDADNGGWANSPIEIVPDVVPGFTIEGQTFEAAINNLGTIMLVIPSNGVDLVAKSYSIPNDTWSNSLAIDFSQPSTSQLDYARVAISDNGAAVAIWRESNGLDTALYANYFDAGFWNSATTRVDNGIGSLFAGVFGLDIAMDAVGNAHAIWSQTASNNLLDPNNTYTRYLDASLFKDTGIWNSIHTLDNSSGAGGSPQIAVNSNGQAIAVWEQNNASTFENDIFSAIYNGNRWSTSEVIDSNDKSAEQPVIAIDSIGNGVAVWIQESDTDEYYSTSNYYSSDTGWMNNADIIDSEDGDESNSPQVTISANGSAIAAWIKDSDRILGNITTD